MDTAGIVGLTLGLCTLAAIIVAGAVLWCRRKAALSSAPDAATKSRGSMPNEMVTYLLPEAECGSEALAGNPEEEFAVDAEHHRLPDSYQPLTLTLAGRNQPGKQSSSSTGGQQDHDNQALRFI